MAIGKHRKRILAGGIILVAGAATVGLASGALINFGRYMPLALTIALLLPLCAAACAAAIPYWKRLDERQRDARLTSWYWGGLFGLAFGTLAALAIGGFHPGRLGDFALGALLVMGTQILGYYAARLVWWQQHWPRAS